MCLKIFQVSYKDWLTDIPHFRSHETLTNNSLRTYTSQSSTKRGFQKWHRLRMKKNLWKVKARTALISYHTPNILHCQSIISARKQLLRSCQHHLQNNPSSCQKNVDFAVQSFFRGKNQVNLYIRELSMKKQFNQKRAKKK